MHAVEAVTEEMKSSKSLKSYSFFLHTNFHNIFCTSSANTMQVSPILHDSTKIDLRKQIIYKKN